MRNRIDWPATAARWGMVIFSLSVWAGIGHSAAAIYRALNSEPLNFTSTCKDLIASGWQVEQSTCVQAFLSAL